jgi:NitT/TauT family transport system substrate-binding protein
MQGSVLVVKDDLLRDHPELVEKLVDMTERGIQYIHQHPDDASRIVAHELTITGGTVFPIRLEKGCDRPEIRPEVIRKSLTQRMTLSTHVDPMKVQECVDYLAKLGYIKRFKAEDMLDLRFLRHE